MADRAGASIVIDAPAAAVLGVIADFAAYPQWAGQIRRAEVLSTGTDGQPSEVALTLDAGLLRDEYVLAYTWLPAGRGVSWHLVRGQVQKSQDGSYRLDPLDPHRTEVRYELAVELTVPMPGLIKRRAEKMVMTTALAELKKRVESLV